MEIITSSVFEAWKESIKKILQRGREEQGFVEVLNLCITITDPLQVDEPINAVRNLKKWLYPEIEEIEDVIFRKETANNYHYTYGQRIFNFANTKNQLENYVIPLLLSDKMTRRAIAIIYDPTKDSEIQNKESPCIISINFKVSAGKLTATAVIRSNDMLLGWPANIYQIYLLQKYVAEKTGLEMGSISTISHSAHIQDSHSEEARKLLEMA